MPWGYAAAAAGAYLANSGKGGGGGTTTQSKEPWAAAVPWLQNNIATGQNLQNHYQQNPFNALQQGSYANLLGNNDYINQMVPGMLGQFSQQQGFDRNNQGTRHAAIQFPTMAQRSPMAGLLNASPSAGGNMNVTQNPFANGLLASAPAAAPAGMPSGGGQTLQDLGSGNRWTTFDPSGGGG